MKVHLDEIDYSSDGVGTEIEVGHERQPPDKTTLIADQACGTIVEVSIHRGRLGTPQGTLIDFIILSSTLLTSHL
jgi:hypothetical protein